MDCGEPSGYRTETHVEISAAVPTGGQDRNGIGRKPAPTIRQVCRQAGRSDELGTLSAESSSGRKTNAPRCLEKQAALRSYFPVIFQTEGLEFRVLPFLLLPCR
jgi:hypothetical protein